MYFVRSWEILGDDVNKVLAKLRINHDGKQKPVGLKLKVNDSIVVRDT